MKKTVFATLTLAAASTLFGGPQASQTKTPAQSSTKPEETTTQTASNKKHSTKGKKHGRKDASSTQTTDKH